MAKGGASRNDLFLIEALLLTPTNHHVNWQGLRQAALAICVQHPSAAERIVQQAIERGVVKEAEWTWMAAGGQPRNPRWLGTLTANRFGVPTVTRAYGNTRDLARQAAAIALLASSAQVPLPGELVDAPGPRGAPLEWLPLMAWVAVPDEGVRQGIARLKEGARTSGWFVAELAARVQTHELDASLTVSVLAAIRTQRAPGDWSVFVNAVRARAPESGYGAAIREAGARDGHWRIPDGAHEGPTTGDDFLRGLCDNLLRIIDSGDHGAVQ